MYQTPKEMVSAQRALSKRNMPGEDRMQQKMQMNE